MRAFLAIQLPESVRSGLASLQSGIELGAPGFFRWVPSSQMHMTLYFLGDIDGDVCAAVTSAAEGIGGRSIELTVGGLLLLPEPQVPRIVAAGVGGDVPALRSLQQRLADTVFPLAPFKETRGFSPHITVGRLKKGMPGNAKALKRTLAGAGLPDSAPFVVDAFELVKSTLGSEGPVYETVHRFGLA